MRTSTTDGYHHGDLPEALLSAVEAIVTDSGVEAVSLRAAARRVGVSHAAPAHHFGDRRGLLTAFATRGFDRLTTSLRAAAGSADAPEEALLASGVAYVRFALEQRAYFQVVFRPELCDHDDPGLAAAGDAAFGVLLECVTACMEVVSAEDPRVAMVAMTCWSLVHGLAHLSLDAPHKALVSPQELAPMLIAVLRDGLRGQPGWRTPAGGSEQT